MSEVIMLNNVRLSFPELIEPSKFGDNPNVDAKYRADFIIEPPNDSLKRFMDEVNKIATEKWKEHVTGVMGIINNDRKLRCYGKGEERVDKKTFTPYLGYGNNTYITAINARAPLMVTKDGTVSDPNNTMAYQALARALYGGCYVNAAVRPWLQENTNGRAVRCELIAVQFLKDGEAFGEGAPNVDGLFCAVAPTPELPDMLGGAPAWPAPVSPFSQ
jgi:hypothetical protein